MYVSKKRREILAELTRLTGAVWRVGKRQEYPTLFRNDEIITQGESEVKSRIDQLGRENAIILW